MESLGSTVDLEENMLVDYRNGIDLAGFVISSCKFVLAREEKMRDYS